MDKYKVAIVDDDEVALENLSFELGKDARFSLKGTARNGKQGKKLIAKVQPDLLFLDVEMPDMTGMELLQEIRGSVSWNMRIVFYTAYDKYMVQAIREAAFDYLLKPFEEQEFRDILARFVEQAEAGQRMSYPIGAPLHTGQTFIVFTPTNDMRALRPAEIGFFRYCSSVRAIDSSRAIGRGNWHSSASWVTAQGTAPCRSCQYRAAACSGVTPCTPPSGSRFICRHSSRGSSSHMGAK